ENRPGAASNIATELVVNAPPDGYMLLVVTSVNTVNATLYERLNFDLIRDIGPVASLHREPFVLAVHPSVPVNTVPEFISHAKATSGRAMTAAAGIGSGMPIGRELFKMMTSVVLGHLPYRGGGHAVGGLFGVQAQVLLAAMSPSIECIRGRKPRAVAVSPATR